jgi:formate hydrogenlyase subunit 4
MDRKISARMQSRWGPPIIQPFLDVLKLFQKENIVVRRSQNFYVFFFFVFVVFTGGIFFTGGDLLLAIFALTLADIFFVLGAYKASSPFSFLGAERELLQIMSYEPMAILAAIGTYSVTRSFFVSDIVRPNKLPIMYQPGIFIGFVATLAFKFRKSPFDLAASHHAHQVLVRGVTTEFSGRTLAMIEIAHRYETVTALGFVALFFANTPLVAAGASLAVWFLMMLVDNTFARVKWRLALQGARIAAGTLGFGNIPVLHLLRWIEAAPCACSGDRPGSSTTTPRAATAATSRSSPVSTPFTASSVSEW